MLESSHIFGAPPRAARFVGREYELSRLEEALYIQQMPGEHRVVSVYGVGGQGKSSLLEQFRCNSLGQQTCIYPWALVDLSSTENTEPQIALLKIRTQLRRFGLDSPAFDLAFARWHQFDRPGRDLKQSYPEFFDKHESIVADLADVAGDLIAEVPGAGLVFKLLSKLSDRYKEWCGRSQPFLRTLDELSITELSNYLPQYLGYDICNFVANDPASRPTILFDSFEALWQRHGGVGSEITSSMPDSWVRDFVDKTPGALFIIAGRNRLHWSEIDLAWDEAIRTYELSELSEIDSFALLGAAGIPEPTIQRHIFNTCEGHPLSLMLQIRIYERLKAKRITPSTEDFPTGQKDIINRFLNHVEPSFASAMKVLAVAQEINADVWRFLSRDFHSCALYSFADIEGDVLFRKSQESSLILHPVLASHLKADVKKRDPDLFKQIQSSLFAYHDLQCKRETGDIATNGSTFNLLEQDRHLLRAASHLAEIDKKRLVGWALQRLIEYHEAGSHSRVLKQLLGSVEPYLPALDMQSDALELMAKVAELQSIANPFDPKCVSMTKRLTAYVANAPSDLRRIKDQLRVIIHHHAIVRNIEVVETLKPLLFPPDELAPGELGERLFLSNVIGDQKTSEALAEEALTSSDKGLNRSELISTASLSEGDDLWARLLQNFSSLATNERLVALAHVLQTILLNHRSDRLDSVLLGFLGSIDLNAHELTVEDKREGLIEAVRALVICCLLANKEWSRAKAELNYFVDDDAVDQVLSLADARQWLMMSPADAGDDLKQHAPAIALSSQCGANWLLTYQRLAVEACEPSSERLLKLTLILSHILGTQLAFQTGWECLEWRETFGDIKVELYVNERGQIIIFTDKPLGWRENDFLTLTGNRLRFCVGGRTREFGIPVHRDLLRYLSGGSRVLMVTMDSVSGEPIYGNYLRMYELDSADAVEGIAREIRASKDDTPVDE